MIEDGRRINQRGQPSAGDILGFEDGRAYAGLIEAASRRQAGQAGADYEAGSELRR
jgi:hypothetical protein